MSADKELGDVAALPPTPCSAQKSDTPETDGEVDHAQNILIDCQREAYQTGKEGDASVVMADFARRLERERDEARELARGWRGAAIAGCEPDEHERFPWEQND